MCPRITLYNLLFPKVAEERTVSRSNKVLKAPKWLMWAGPLLYAPLWVISPFILAHWIIDDLIDNFFVSLFLGYLIILFLDYIIACALLKEDNDTDGAKDR